MIKAITTTDRMSQVSQDHVAPSRLFIDIVALLLPHGRWMSRNLGLIDRKAKLP
jgi:hypothetical protein